MLKNAMTNAIRAKNTDRGDSSMSILRKIMIETRNRMKNRGDKNKLIEEKLFSFLSPNLKNCFVFASSGSEVETRRIMERLLNEGVHVYCPKVLGRSYMEFFEIHSLDDLQDGSERPYKIQEPVLPEGMTPEEAASILAAYPEDREEDVMLVPGVAFDETGGRVGYGSGYYDRYLSGHPCYKVALCFECQVTDHLTLKETDVRMDALVTEEKIRVWRDIHED